MASPSSRDSAESTGPGGGRPATRSSPRTRSSAPASASSDTSGPAAASAAPVPRPVLVAAGAEAAERGDSVMDQQDQQENKGKRPADSARTTAATSAAEPAKGSSRPSAATDTHIDEHEKEKEEQKPATSTGTAGAGSAGGPTGTPSTTQAAQTRPTSAEGDGESSTGKGKDGRIQAAAAVEKNKPAEQKQQQQSKAVTRMGSGTIEARPKSPPKPKLLPMGQRGNLCRVVGCPKYKQAGRDGMCAAHFNALRKVTKGGGGASGAAVATATRAGPALSKVVAAGGGESSGTATKTVEVEKRVPGPAVTAEAAKTLPKRTSPPLSTSTVATQQPKVLSSTITSGSTGVKAPASSAPAPPRASSAANTIRPAAKPPVAVPKTNVPTPTAVMQGPQKKEVHQQQVQQPKQQQQQQQQQQQPAQPKKIVWNPPTPIPYRPLPDPEIVRISRNVLKLLQIYGPLTAELIEYNLPPLSRSGAGKLQKVLDILVATEVIGIVSPPNLAPAQAPTPASSSVKSAKAPQATTPKRTDGAMQTDGKAVVARKGTVQSKTPAFAYAASAPTKPGVAAGATRLVPSPTRPATNTSKTVATTGLVTAAGASVPSQPPPATTPPSKVAPQTMVASVVKAAVPTGQLIKKTPATAAPASGQGVSLSRPPTVHAQASVKAAVALSASSKVGALPNKGIASSSVIKQSSAPTQSHIPGKQTSPYPPAVTPKFKPQPIRYVFLDGRPRADVVLPHELPDLIRSVDAEMRRTHERIKILREELSVVIDNDGEEKSEQDGKNETNGDAEMKAEGSIKSTGSEEAGGEQEGQNASGTKRGRKKRKGDKAIEAAWPAKISRFSIERAKKPAKEVLRLILNDYAEIIHDPVYVAALRNIGIDIVTFERERESAKLAKKARDDEESRKKEANELILAAGGH